MDIGGDIMKLQVLLLQDQGRNASHQQHTDHEGHHNRVAGVRGILTLTRLSGLSGSNLQAAQGCGGKQAHSQIKQPAFTPQAQTAAEEGGLIAEDIPAAAGSFGIQHSAVVGGEHQKHRGQQLEEDIGLLGTVESIKKIANEVLGLVDPDTIIFGTGESD